MLKSYLEVRSKLLPSYGNDALSQKHKKYLDIRFKLLPVDNVSKYFFGAQEPVETVPETEEMDGEGAILSELEQKLATSIFNMIDVEKTGAVDINALGRALSMLNAGFTEQQVIDLMLNIDENGDGEIELDEFLEWWGLKGPYTAILLQNYNELKRSREAMAKSIFAAIDFHERGEINRASLGKAFRAFKMGMLPEQVDAVMVDLDLENKGKIEESDFVRWWHKQGPITSALKVRVDAAFNTPTPAPSVVKTKIISEKEREEKLMAIASRPSKIPKARSNRQKTKRLSKTTSPVRGSLTPMELEKSRKAAEKRIADRKRKDRAKREKNASEKTKQDAKRQEALRKIEEERQHSKAPIKANAKPRSNRVGGRKKTGWKDQQKLPSVRPRKRMASYEPPRPVSRNVFTKRSFHEITPVSGPVTFFVRDNEKLSIETIKGKGKLLVDVSKLGSNSNISGACVYDSKAMFYLNGDPTRMRGDPVYPGELRYDFYVNEEEGGNNLPLWVPNDSQDHSGLLVEFVLYCEFRSEDRLDSSSAEMLNEFSSETASWAKQATGSKWRSSPSQKLSTSKSENFLPEITSKPTEIMSHTIGAGSARNAGVLSSENENDLNSSGESLYVSPNSRPKTIGHVDDAIDSLLMIM